MADPKYASLPGIDVEGHDVYESGDLPEEDQHLPSEDLDSTSVEVVDIDTNTAFSKFSGKYLSGIGKDFSGKIQGKQMTGYRANEYGLAVLGEQETVMQKYNRLKMEVGDLLLEMDQGSKAKKEEVFPSKLLQQVESLNNVLQNAESEELTKTFEEELNVTKLISSLGDLGKSSGNKPTNKQDGSYQLYLKPGQSQKQGLKFAELEQRLAQLEKTLGFGTGDVNVLASHSSSGNLQDAVQAMEAKLSLLDPEQLPQVDSRLQAILNKVNDINKAHKASGDQPSEVNKKITELYEIVQKWEGVRIGLPQLLERLNSLNSLHVKAGEFTSAVSHLESTQSQISSRLDVASSTQTKLLEMLKENTATVKTNLTQLQDRIDKLK